MKNELRNLALSHLDSWGNWGCVGQQGMLDILVSFAEKVLLQKIKNGAVPQREICPDCGEVIVDIGNHNYLCGCNSQW
jgi:hypothetical protein